MTNLQDYTRLIEQRINYTHKNPVRAMIVFKAGGLSLQFGPGLCEQLLKPNESEYIQIT